MGGASANGWWPQFRWMQHAAVCRVLLVLSEPDSMKRHLLVDLYTKVSDLIFVSCCQFDSSFCITVRRFMYMEFRILVFRHFFCHIAARS